MNRRAFSSSITISQIQQPFQGQLQQIQKQHSKNQILHLKKQNNLLKKQLEQIKQIQQQTKKQLNLYRSLVHSSNFTQNGNKSQSQKQMNQVFEMQHKKIFDLETQLEILQEKYNKAISNAGSRKETEYAVKCKQLEKRLERTEVQYQKEIAALKHKLMKFNASQIIQTNNNNFSKKLPTSPSTQLKPLSGHLRRF